MDDPIGRFGAVPEAAVPNTNDQPSSRGQEAVCAFAHALLPALHGQLRRAGEPHGIDGANRRHYWWIAEWRAAFPDAAIYLAPCTKQQAGDRLGFDGLARDAQSGHPWDAEIETLPIARGCDERPATLHP